MTLLSFPTLSDGVAGWAAWLGFVGSTAASYIFPTLGVLGFVITVTLLLAERRARKAQLAPASPNPVPTAPRPNRSPWLIGLEREIAECAIAAEDLERERMVRGNAWFSEALMRWVEKTDSRLAEASAGDLLDAFRANKVPTQDIAEQMAYLRKQQRLLGDAFKRLRG
jgi:hypothetical protein